LENGKVILRASNRTKTPLLLLVFLLTAVKPLAAYTDPGSGTLIWQILVGGFVGLSFEFRRICSWVSQVRGKIRGGSRNSGIS
jgi:hypothetical protein